MKQTVTAERIVDILERAGAAGFAVSERQLKRWHFDGLIPRPTQLWSEGISGSETIYPAGTSNQLLVLCSIRRKYRRSKVIGWKLWWLGFPVDEKYWRTVLNERAASLDKYVPKLIDAIYCQNNNGAVNRFSKWRTMRIRDKLFRQLRKRLGQNNFNNFTMFLAGILDGKFDGWNAAAASDDRDLVRDKMMIDKALGLHRAKNVAQIEEKPRLYDDIEHVFVLLSGRLGGACIADVLNACTDDQIVNTRNEMHGLLELASRSNLAPQNSGLGFKIFAKFAEYAAAPTHQAMLLCLLAMKEDSAFQANLTRFLDELRNAIFAVYSREQIESVRTRDPALVDLCIRSNSNSHVKSYT